MQASRCLRSILGHNVSPFVSHAAIFASRTFSSVDSSLVDDRFAPADFEAASAVVYADFVTDAQANSLVNELAAKLKRRRYERGHWDAVIIKYKETELVDEDLSESTQSVLLNVRQHLETNHTGPVTWLSSHAIDLHADGELNAHVDSVRFSGGIVAGLSLLSPSIMRLRPEQPEGAQAEDKGHVDLLLPVRSLYVLSAVSRYRYTHELLPNGSVFRGSPVERGHRLSIIFRDALRE